MNILLLTVIICLLIIIFILHKRKVSSNKELKYIEEKLIEILDDRTDEYIKVFTDKKIVKELLNAINDHLEENHKIRLESYRYEEAMRKMLSNASHDLKTPLTVINGYIETIILDKDMSMEEKDELIEKIYSRTKDLIKLINMVFSLAKLESDDIKVSLGPVDIVEVCKKNILSFYDICQKKGIEVKLDIPDIQVLALANEDMLERVLNNLISNAISYGSDGKVLGLNIKTINDYIQIDVWDEGKGIDEKYYDFVFERLYTLEDSRNKSYQGSGLGLTITKRLVEKMEGSISVLSKANKKTTFTVTLKAI